jgi:hypothetical protein
LVGTTVTTTEEGLAVAAGGGGASLALTAVPVALVVLGAAEGGLYLYDRHLDSELRDYAKPSPNYKPVPYEPELPIHKGTPTGQAKKATAPEPDGGKPKGPDDEDKRRKDPIHHVATDKSPRTWTPLFQTLFDKAHMSLQDPLNKCAVPGHQGMYGPYQFGHPPLYHQRVYQRLVDATTGPDGKELNGDAYTNAFRAELGKMNLECMTPGTELNTLITVFGQGE